MKSYCLLCLLMLIPLVFRGQDFSKDRLLTVRSKDSIDNQPRLTGSLGTNIKLNGYFDVFGGLQDSETFNIGNIDIFGTDDSGSLKMDMYQTQIKMEGSFIQTNGEKIKAVVEFDFWGGNGHMRLRKAFIETGHWQIGQNWNNFGDESLWPNIMEWEGPPSGIWTRTPHIKYFNTFNNEHWKYEISIEAPVINYASLGDLEPMLDEVNQVTPDLTFAIKNQHDWGHIRLSSILRNVKYELDDKVDDFIGYGFAFSGMYTTANKNNFQFQLVGGEGISAYMTSIAGLGYDGYANVHGKLEATPSFGGWLSYEYYFTEKLHSNIVFGFANYGFDDMERFILANDLIPEDAVYRGDYHYRHSYGIINLMYEPYERVTLGLELDYGAKNLDAKGSVNNIFIDDSKNRDAMRISFGFMFYI